MNKWIRYWNQNRKKVIITIAVIAFIIIIIQIINNFMGNMQKRENKEKNNTVVDKTNPIQSTLTGEKVSENITKQNTDVIKEFVDYCNKKDYQKAYDILTDECKNEFGNSIDNFIKQYCNNIFTSDKTYNLELWIALEGNYTYKIKYFENNLLATGGTSLAQNIEDYITITTRNKENKLNINGFIGKQELNKTQVSQNVEIVVNSRNIYKNYESYNITIKNYTDKTILISSGENSKDICLVDTNKVEYPSFMEEIPSENLLIPAKYARNITIRFNKIYDMYRSIECIRYKNIIVDQEKYNQNPNDPNLEKIQMEIVL